MNEQINRRTPRQLAGSIFWGVVSLLFGWTLFAYWWAEVLAENQARPLSTMLLVVAVFAVFVLVGTFVWIWHNRRIAARGSRGTASRFTVPRYDLDAVGREILILHREGVRSADVVRIESTEQRKTYSAGADSAA
jgi:hypothetical protein